MCLAINSITVGAENNNSLFSVPVFSFPGGRQYEVVKITVSLCFSETYCILTLELFK